MGTNSVNSTDYENYGGYINPNFKAGEVKTEAISPQTKITYATKPDEFVKEEGLSTGTTVAIGIGTLAMVGLGALAFLKGRGIKLPQEINLQKFKEMGGVFKKGKAYINGKKVTGTIVFCEEKGTKTVYNNGKIDKVFRNGILSRYYDKEGKLVRRFNFNIANEQNYLDKLSNRYGKKIKFEQTEYGKFWERKQRKILDKMTRIEGRSQEIVAQGETVEQRVNNFLNNKDYVVANPDTHLPKMPSYKREPHSYNTSLQDTFINTKPYDPGCAEYYGVWLKDGKVIRNPNNGEIANLNTPNTPKFAIGKTPDGRAFVQYTILGSNRDVRLRHIPESVTILSKNGEFTPVQKDLIRALGSKTQNMKTHRFPMLECTRDIKSLVDKECQEFVASEDVLFSGIQSMAKNTAENTPNRFLSRLQNIKNGEVLYDVP